MTLTWPTAHKAHTEKQPQAHVVLRMQRSRRDIISMKGIDAPSQGSDPIEARQEDRQTDDGRLGHVLPPLILEESPELDHCSDALI